jgi:CRISPR-associated endonuclease/helicase Cas3
MRTPRSKKTGFEVSGIPPLPLEQCLAKTWITKDLKRVAGRSVLDHCCIVGEVARLLVKQMPSFLREHLFPLGTALVAASHDVGKISPTFQKKIHSAIIPCNEKLLALMESIDPNLEVNWGGHAGVSQCSLDGIGAGPFIPKIAGLHHGTPPQLNGKSCNAEQFGGPEWQWQRERLVDTIKNCMDENFPVIDDHLQARVLAGLTCVADWIGSGGRFDDPCVPWRMLVPEAVAAAGFISPRFMEGLAFRDIFGFEPREIQQRLIEQVSEPGIYILEAPMGIGKTEAALYAAYSMVASGKASGIYFALPTQMTSNRIYIRMNAFLQQVLAADSSHRASILLHSNAWLKEFELGEEGVPGRSWFHTAKRGLLAPFAVGTIDQALMASMNVKHGFVRTFGLAGKVVILDEVHTYDAYTGTILDRLVDELRQLHCTVVILSATLTNERRWRLLGANSSGDAPYPVILSLPSGRRKPIETIPAVSVGNTVEIRHVYAVDDAFEESIIRAESGQQVLWIENTVSEAQKAFSILAARSDGTAIECGLLHSRFIQADRELLEEYWVSRYGKDGVVQRGDHGRILVGTQVLEQSLDIDADFLVTRICPTDMLLQRIGRLWRHASTNRPEGAACEAWVLTVGFQSAEAVPEKAFGMTAFIYSPYVLLRTLQALESITKISLPGDIRGLLETTYETKNESEAMMRHKADLDRKKERLERFALQGVSMDIGTIPESRASTRYSEIETVELLLLRAIQYDRVKHGVIVTLLDGRTLFLPATFPSDARKQQRELSASLARQILRVSVHEAPFVIPHNDMEWLRPYFYLGDERTDASLLRVALVGEDRFLMAPFGGRVSDSLILSYKPHLGYQAQKTKV